MSDVSERMQELARTVEVILPPGTGFVVLAFDLGVRSSRMEYVSNAQRESIVLAMREFIVKTEGRFGEHQTEAHRQNCPTCGQKFGTNEG